MADQSEPVYYAHTLEQCPETEWQPLADHLLGVADRAAEFAEAFGASDWGRLAGRMHDLGKFSRAFQEYLREATSSETNDRLVSGPRVDHSTAGAQHSSHQFGGLGHLLAYVIASHHSGLLNGIGSGACLHARLTKQIEPWLQGAADFAEVEEPGLPEQLQKALSVRDGFAVALFVRMLFSCLIDADRLDTEEFASPDRASLRPRWPTDVFGRMQAALDAHVDRLGASDSRIDRARSHVREACQVAALHDPGLFSLTVPTGGGKTLASLAFALRHAVEHDLSRVIYVMPFTTIIEQNAQVFRDVLSPLSEEYGVELVLEHHSNVDYGPETTQSEILAENWDSPLVVTTSVQFYESLFASRTSKCRKLHRLARSVVVLDEAQTLPVEYLHPCLRVLDELTKSYGTTVVLCTATQPAVHKRDGFPHGLEGVREIMPRPRELYEELKRVEIVERGPLSDEALIAELLGLSQALCIVNTRGHARRLFMGLGDGDGHYHLSAQMCPTHRSEVLAKIRACLATGGTCRVVSTQLIEAGVDIDFPVVFRSMAGLDSIAQAAGRCNRNARLAGMGSVQVFRSEHVRSERFFANTTNCASTVLPLYSDKLSLEAIEHYFRLYYWDRAADLDAKKIMNRTHLLGHQPDFPFSFDFADIASDFRLIEDSGRAVIIPWGEAGRQLCEELRSCVGGPSRKLLRKLQRYTVTIPSRVWEQHINREVECVHERYPVLVNAELHYSESTGLSLDDEQPAFLGS